MLESLSEKLNLVFKKLGSKGRLTEKDIDDALREVRMALLGSDVNYKVAKNFVESIRERSLNSDILQFWAFLGRFSFFLVKNGPFLGAPT